MTAAALPYPERAAASAGRTDAAGQSDGAGQPDGGPYVYYTQAGAPVIVFNPAGWASVFLFEVNDGRELRRCWALGHPGRLLAFAERAGLRWSFESWPYIDQMLKPVEALPNAR